MMTLPFRIAFGPFFKGVQQKRALDKTEFLGDMGPLARWRYHTGGTEMLDIDFDGPADAATHVERTLYMRSCRASSGLSRNLGNTGRCLRRRALDMSGDLGLGVGQPAKPRNPADTGCHVRPHPPKNAQSRQR